MKTYKAGIVEKGLGEARNTGALRAFAQYPLRSTVAVLMLALCSCTVSNKDWNVAFGGKGAYSGRDFSVTWDNEDSFRTGAAIAGLAVGAYQAVAVQKSADALNATQHTNVTKQAINANNNATAVELGAQKTGLETTKILNPAP